MVGSRIVGAVVGAICALLPLEVCRSQANAFPPLLDATLEELQWGLETGSFTSVDLVRAYIARIDEVNADLRPINELNPDALLIAAQMDVVRKMGSVPLGPLHGIPVLVKDNIATDDKMNNTAGSYALLGATVEEDSTVVAKLRRAGAIILGKTNLSQWADCRGNMSSGWSAYGGQTLGAYFPGHDPSGSSSGSAVASSLGLAWASLGTETSGSICHPSHMNNIVGIKPTVGLTSRYLVVPISEHQDTVGPMARTVKDAAHLLAAIAGRDVKDNYTLASPFEDGLPDYVAACKESGLQGKRLGVPRNLLDWGIDETSLPAFDVFNATLDLLRSAGAHIVDDIHLPGVDLMTKKDGEHIFKVGGADFLTDLPRDYLKKLRTNPNNITSLAELRDFTVKHPLEGYPEIDVSVWDAVLEQGLDNTSPEFWGNYTQQRYYAGHLGLTGALKNHSLDAIVMPTPYAYLLSACLGLPVVTVPLGKAPDDTPVRKTEFGLNRTAPNQPFSLGFAGDAFSEETLIGMAYAFEQRTLVRKTVKPYIEPTTELRDVVRKRGGGRAKLYPAELKRRK